MTYKVRFFFHRIEISGLYITFIERYPNGLMNITDKDNSLNIWSLTRAAIYQHVDKRTIL